MDPLVQPLEYLLINIFPILIYTFIYPIHNTNEAFYGRLVIVVIIAVPRICINDSIILKLI